ncbi:MAG: hypothetical protein LBS60_13400 [Deltaproteobacteria bacterium]|nr:hypothetical protein [Deltaproteobacteria bacterium]
MESADFNALYLPIGPSYEITNEKLIVKYGVKFDSRGFFQIMKTLGQTLDAISLEKELVPFSDAVVRSNKELAQGKLTSNVRPYFLDYPRPDPPYKTIFVPINTNSIVVYLVDKETIDAFNNLLYTKYNKGEPFNLNLMDVNCALEISAGGKVIDLYSDIVTIDAVIDSSADSLSFTPFLFNKDAIPPTLKLEAVKEFPLQDFNIDHTNIHNQIKTKLSINISYR